MIKNPINSPTVLTVLAVFAPLGCSGNGSSIDAGTDTDADTDSESDTDTDTDSDTDPDADTDSDTDTDTDPDGGMDGGIDGGSDTLGDGTAWTEHLIIWGVDGAYFGGFPADIDLDGDLDVLIAEFAADEVSWWESDCVP